MTTTLISKEPTNHQFLKIKDIDLTINDGDLDCIQVEVTLLIHNKDWENDSSQEEWGEAWITIYVCDPSEESSQSPLEIEIANHGCSDLGELSLECQKSIKKNFVDEINPYFRLMLENYIALAKQIQKKETNGNI